MTLLTKLHARGAGFLAAEHIYAHDCLPLRIAEIYVAIDFGKNAQNREIALNRGIASGWITKNRGGDICISPEAVVYFDSLEAPKSEFQGKVAAPRTPLWGPQDWPPIAQKNIPSRQANRDVPEHSVRDHMSFRTVAGGSL